MVRRRNFRKKNLGKKSKRFYRRRGIRRSRPIKGQGGNTIKYNNALRSTHRVRKTNLLANYFTAGTPGANVAFNPTVGAMPDFSSYSNIFSHFMINSFSITFKWVDLDTGGTVSLQDVRQPVLNICYNNDGNLTNANLLQDKRNVCQHTFTPDKTVFTYTFYPKTISPVYYSTVASGYKSNRKCFIDCDYSATPHYGCLIYIDQIPGGTQINMDYHWDVTFKHQQ